ncbi:HEPN domain-containing protein [Virgibacillus sp. SK37]|uniref:ApeA N-terminal domain 1-containing protein n=1 Tax=Virgibacillus sp. SK37 TaxID=403957 RepID=UPI0011A65939|nr:HEPN domain-containing protein [Virgibacillus sp. SK37]
MKVNLSATGFWKINNTGENYTGDLYLNEDKGGIVLYIRIPNNGPIMSYLELPLEIPFITGSTINGAEITLVKCSRISTNSRIGTEEVFGYKAQFMFNGLNFNKEEDIRFSKMTISIPGIIQWGDVSNYVRPALDKKGDSLIDLKIVEPIEIFSNEIYGISYYLSFSDPFHLMKEQLTLKQTPHLIIEAQSLQTIEWFMKIADQMKRLIEIAVGVPLSYDSMIVESPDIYYEFEDDEKHIRPLEVIHAHKHTLKGENNNERLIKHDYIFSLSELKQANFSQWQEVSTIMEPIIELYIDSLYNQNLSVSRHFLNMVQALETYHSRRIAYSLHEFKERVEKLLELRPEAFRKQDRKFLLEGCRNFVVLRSRLADLLLADYRFIFHTGEFKFIELPQLIAQTRNYYTHYNQKLEEKALKGEDLITAFHILRNILEFYLLKELGFKEDFIHERTRERIKPIMTSNDIRKADKRKHEMECK